MSILLRVAWRNLWRGWRRSALVLCAIAVGLSGSLALVAWTRGMVHQMADNAIRTQLGHIAVHARGYHQNPDVKRVLPDGGRRVLEVLGARPGVHASPRLVGDGLMQSARANLRAAIVGVEPEREREVSLVADGIVEGAWFARAPARARPARSLRS